MTVRRRRPRLFEERLAGIAGGAFLGNGGGRPRGIRPLNDGSGTPSLPYETEGDGGGGGGEAAPVQADGNAVTIQTMGISWDVGPGVHEFYDFAGSSDPMITNPYSSVIGFTVGGLWTCSMQIFFDYSTLAPDARFQIYDDSSLFVTPVFSVAAPSGMGLGDVALRLPQMTAFVQVEADATFYTQFYITVFDDSPFGGSTQHIEGLSMVFTLTLPQFAV